MTDYLPWSSGGILYANFLNQAMGYAPNIYQIDINVTSTGSQTYFVSPLKYCIIRNIGSDNCSISTGSPVTTDDYNLDNGDSIVLNGGETGIGSLYYIGGTGSSASLRILGTY